MAGRRPEEIENSKMTTKSFLVFSLFAFFLAGCGGHGDLVKENNEFGIKCAKMGLWNEASVRWERVLEIDPNNADAHNNLGIAHESMGEFGAAEAEYSKAVELDPENKTYKKNYDRFKLNYERVSKAKEAQEAPETQNSDPQTWQ